MSSVVALKDSMNVGLEENARKSLAHKLSVLLADSYALYLKTQYYHWNVTGPQFHSLHTMFEEQYTDLAAAVDDIAERVRALGYVAPGSFAEFAELSSVVQDTKVPEASEMVKQLSVAHETVIKSLRALADEAGEAGDEVTAGMAADRLTVHEKTAWMLRSSV